MEKYDELAAYIEQLLRLVIKHETFVRLTNLFSGRATLDLQEKNHNF